MKPNAFKYSVLTVGVIAAMGIAGTANAAAPDSGAADSEFDVVNIASASYLVEGNDTPQEAESNPVTVTVSENSSFTLVANSADGQQGDDQNVDLDINPQSGESVDFIHTLTNNGNVSDTYTIDIDNITNGTGDDTFDYDNFTISYVKDGNTVTINSGDTIELAPGESVEFTITATSNTQRVVGEEGFITVTASSQYLEAKNPGDDAKFTASNTDNAVTVTPIYAIVKSANTNLNNNTFDTNNPNAFVDYTITVKNEGNADGTAVTITDVLPAGLIAITDTSAPNYSAPSTTTTGSSTNVTPSISADGKTVTVTGQDIAVGEEITVTFRVKNDPANSIASSGTSIDNFAIVEDDVNGDGTFDLVDSSSDGNEGTTENNYENPNQPTVGVDNDDNATIITSNQDRKITITPGDDKEVALVSTGNVYTYTITNEGTDVTEADEAGEVLFTVLPETDSNVIDIERVFVDANNDGVFNQADGDILLDEVNNVTGQYDLNQAAPTGLEPDEEVTISVEVSSNGQGSNATNGTNNIGDFETIDITVLPQTEVDQTPAPDSVETSSTTTLQGIDLFKFQAVDECSVAVTSITNWSSPTANIVGTAEPGQCIFYKLEATNTFNSTNINDIVLSDTLASEVTYRSDFTATPAATDQSAAPLVQGEFDTLNAGQTGIIKFSVSTSTESQTTP